MCVPGGWLNGPRPAEQMQDQRNHRHDQQQVDETAGYVKCQPSRGPNPDQDKEQDQENKITYHM